MRWRLNNNLLFCFIAFVACLYFYNIDISAEEIEQEIIEESSEMNLEPDVDPMNPMDSFAIENLDSIEDGDYFIQSAMDENYVLDVSGGSKSNGGNVQIYEQNYTYAQGWNVSHDENGYVTFSCLNSILALDGKAANVSNNTNIQQYESNGTKAQKWVVVKENGLYKIISALDSNYVLDVNGDTAKNSQNVQLYKFDGSASQFWNFIKFETMRQHLDTLAKENENVIQDGQYSFQSYINTNYVVDVSGGSLQSGGNIQVYTSNNTDAQGWIVSHDTNGYVTLKNVKSGLVLDVASAKTTNGTNVQQFTSNNTYAQKWIVLNRNGKYVFISALDSRMVLDINSGKAINGQNIQIYKSNGTKAQEWHIVIYKSQQQLLDELAIENKNTITDGLYEIHSVLDSTAVLDVKSGSLDNGANIQLYEANGTEAQVWKITNLSDGYVSIINEKSGKALDVTSAKTVNGTNIQQYTSNSTKAQKWILISTGNGIKIVSALNSSFVLDLNAAKTVNGTNIQLYQSNDTNAQRWNFIPYLPWDEKLDLMANENRNTLTEGIYKVICSGNQNFVWDLLSDTAAENQNIQVYTDNGTKAQMWKIRKDENGYLSILSLSNNRYLTVSSNNVVQKTWANTSYQKWIATLNPNGSITFITGFNPYYVLDVASFKNGGNLQIARLNQTSNQQYIPVYIRDILQEEDIDLSYTEILIDSQSNTMGEFSSKITGLESNAVISRVYMGVWTKENKSDLKWFEGTKQSDGTYILKANASDFGYYVGDYNVSLNVYLDGDIIKEIGTGTVTVKETLNVLKNQIQNYLNSHTYSGESWTVYVQLLNDTQSNININSHQQQSASSMKLFVMGAVYQNYESLVSRYGKSTVDSNLHAMITVSDNDAWVNLTNMLGNGNYAVGANVITSWANSHGYTDTSARSGYYQNFSSARDTAWIVKDIYQGNLRYSDRMLSLLKQQTRKTKIPAGIPSGIVTGNKTGELGGTENDTAIIYGPKQTYVLSIMSTNLVSNSNAQAVIRNISSIVYNYLNV